MSHKSAYRFHWQRLFLLFWLMPVLLLARSRKDQSLVSLSDLLPQLDEELSPACWHQGMPFVFLKQSVGLSLSAEQPAAVSDTVGLKGSVWHYDSMVSEEDWMGQELLQLRFISPKGDSYRFSTGRPMSVVSDRSYQPVIDCLYPLQIIQQVDSALRARSFYILLHDHRVHYSTDTVPGVKHQKFVTVEVDSVTCGNELAPLKVHFHRDASATEPMLYGYFLASLPGSRETGTSTSLDRFLALTDPYLLHPDILPEVWSLIQDGSVRLDMTAEEVRLSWGRPTKVDKAASRNGMIELWYYSNNRVLQMWDGRLYKIGVL